MRMSVNQKRIKQILDREEKAGKGARTDFS